jgi:dimethylargininase
VNFSHAIVRPPGRSFADGLTTSTEGRPDYHRAVEQHGRYCEALRACGLSVTEVAADEAHPDATFVEDTAIVSAHGAVVTVPGAPSRRGEVAAIQRALQRFFSRPVQMTLPGTLDGGDVAQADEHFYIGLSQRTNAAGAQQLATLLRGLGFSTDVVDMGASPALLHLKTGIAYLGDGVWVLATGAADIAAQLGAADGQIIRVAAGESYAANCVRINDRVLVAEGYPHLLQALRERGYAPLPVDVSEFRKMDGGLSCLSLRF